MSPEMFIFVGVLFLIPFMYGFSMLWYSFVSKKRGIYVIEILVAVAAFIGIIALLVMANSVWIGDALVALFGAFFLIPVIVGALGSALLVKLTIVWLKKDEQP